MATVELARSFDLPRRSVALVLAGGRGSRLKHLTDHRAKPAVYFGGKFRIIDFTLSNCLNSGIRRIGVITQYKSHSLLRHLQRGWAFLKSEMNEFVDLLPAQQRTDDESWYRGTADAVYQNLDIVRGYRADYVVVLAGDHIYKMNYALMLADHVAKGRQCTVGCIAVPREEARGFGVMAVDDEYRITDFVEKPADPPPMPGRPDLALASMGIYIFDADYLYRRVGARRGRSRFEPRLRQGHHPAHGAQRLRLGTSLRTQRGSHPARGGAVLARRRHHRRLLGRQHRPHGHGAAAQPVRHALAGVDLPPAVAAGQVRAQPGRPARRRGRIAGLRGLHRVGRGCPQRAVLQRPGALVLVGQLVGAPSQRADRPRGARHPRCHRPGCVIPDGMVIGEDAQLDSQRFHRSENGIALVTREMLERLAA